MYITNILCFTLIHFIRHVCDKESNSRDYQLIKIFKHSLYFYNPVQFFGMEELLLVPTMGSKHNPHTRTAILEHGSKSTNQSCNMEGYYIHNNI